MLLKYRLLPGNRFTRSFGLSAVFTNNNFNFYQERCQNLNPTKRFLEEVNLYMTVLSQPQHSLQNATELSYRIKNFL